MNPKRCRHTSAKAVVPFFKAVIRCHAACDAGDKSTDEPGNRPVILARTDAACLDFEEVIKRTRPFPDAGADGTFIEAPERKNRLIIIAEKYRDVS